MNERTEMLKERVLSMPKEKFRMFVMDYRKAMKFREEVSTGHERKKREKDQAVAERYARILLGPVYLGCKGFAACTVWQKLDLLREIQLYVEERAYAGK